MSKLKRDCYFFMILAAVTLITNIFNEAEFGGLVLVFACIAIAADFLHAAVKEIKGE